MPVLSRLLRASRRENTRGLTAPRRRRRRETGPRGSHSRGRPREGWSHVPSSAGRREPTRPRPARAHPGPASFPGPTGPALRANPFPEVTDPICRLPLPTLFHRPEAVHLGDLLRIWVRPGAKFTQSPRGFQGPAGAHRTPQEPRCFTGPLSLSPGEPIPGIGSFTKKRELFPGPPPTSPASFASPHASREGRSPRPGSGILTRFPFDRPRASFLTRRG